MVNDWELALVALTAVLWLGWVACLLVGRHRWGVWILGAAIGLSAFALLELRLGGIRA